MHILITMLDRFFSLSVHHRDDDDDIIKILSIYFYYIQKINSSCFDNEPTKFIDQNSNLVIDLLLILGCPNEHHNNSLAHLRRLAYVQ